MFYLHPEPWGNDPIWRFAYFSDGLVQPPTRIIYIYIYTHIYILYIYLEHGDHHTWFASTTILPCLHYSHPHPSPLVTVGAVCLDAISIAFESFACDQQAPWRSWAGFPCFFFETPGNPCKSHVFLGKAGKFHVCWGVESRGPWFPTIPGPNKFRIFTQKLRQTTHLPGSITLPEANSSRLKMDGWKTSFLFGYVSFREGGLLVS